MTTPSGDHAYNPERVLVVAAHPDDIEFTCAGTIARWVRTGALVRYVLCTSGQVGIKKPHYTIQQVAEIREREQIAAAHRLGVEDVVFLGYQDGVLENTLEFRKQLVRQIRQFRPEVLLTTSSPQRLLVPDNNYINHPDHRAAAAAALDAVFPAAGMPHLYQDLEAEGLKAHETRKVYVMDYDTPNVRVDITDTIDLKIAALREHASQIEEMGEWDVEAYLRDRGAQFARASGVDGVRYAEGFRVVTLKSDADWQRCKGNVLPEDCPEQPYTDAETSNRAARR